MVSLLSTTSPCSVSNSLHTHTYTHGIEYCSSTNIHSNTQSISSGSKYTYTHIANLGCKGWQDEDIGQDILQLWCQPLPPICMQVQKKEWADMMQVVCTTVQSSGLIMAIWLVFISYVLSTNPRQSTTWHCINGSLSSRQSHIDTHLFSFRFSSVCFLCFVLVVFYGRQEQVNLTLFTGLM